MATLTILDSEGDARYDGAVLLPGGITQLVAHNVPLKVATEFTRGTFDKDNSIKRAWVSPVGADQSAAFICWRRL